MRSILMTCYLTITGLMVIDLAEAQVAAAKFTVKVPGPDTAKHVMVFLAGSFNDWKSHDSLYIMDKEDETTYSLLVPLFEGKAYSYKYTLGNWNRVETKMNDSDISNRQLYSKNGMIINDTVLKWKAPPSTQSKTVSPQMQKMMAIKDSAAVQLKAMLNDLLVLLKQYNENMLAPKPSGRLHKEQQKQTIEIFAKMYRSIESKIWEIGTSLTPEQKQKILAALKSPNASTDLINTLKNAYGDALK